MTRLRDYQIEMLGRLRSAWAEGKRSVMVQMPTGTGKTVLLAEVLGSLSPDPSPVREGGRLARSEDVKEGRVRVLIVAHRRELIEQIQETIEKLKIEKLKVEKFSKYGASQGAERKIEKLKIEKFFEGSKRPEVERSKYGASQGAERKVEKLDNEGEGGKGEGEKGEGVTAWVESIQKLTSILKNEKLKIKSDKSLKGQVPQGGGQNDNVQFSILNSQFDLIIIDEAHHALAKTYKALWERWPKARFLGLTATPCRLNGAPFTELFDVMLQSRDIQWFIKEGWLSDFEYVSVQPDSEEMRKVKGLRKRSADGDYQTKEMATVLDVPESIEHLYNTYQLYTRGKKGIVYAIDRAHAQHIAEYYCSKGVRACWIEAKTPAKERERLVREYREGHMDVIVNVDIFSEGFDCPEVEFIQLARPTLSLAKYLQQVGRGMRVSKGKPFVTILDQVGLYQTFGLPTDNRDWQKTFLGKAVGKGLTAGEERPLIIRDEVADKRLLNLEMLHIKRFNERRTRLEVFLQGGRFGIMCMGHVTCSPQFRRVQRLRRSKYYALAVYDDTRENYTTVIDNEGRNMRLAFRGEVSIQDDIFIQKDAYGQCVYYDAISGNTYYRFPLFQMVAGLEVEGRWGTYYLRDWEGKLTTYLTKKGTHYNDHIVITDDVLINKAEGNSQSRIQGYLDDGILVSAERGIGYQLVSTDGRRSEVLALRPRETTSVPDWERLGLQSLGDEYE